jgi:hypothetical protein
MPSPLPSPAPDALVVLAEPVVVEVVEVVAWPAPFGCVLALQLLFVALVALAVRACRHAPPVVVAEAVPSKAPPSP